ncbi:hypothetical protein [Gemelliphila palaticanis]|uniref:Uncharacterized protein n=1 Tax=Gemelliphila palaticanis TaxID=81950 RepID=A0ABX2SZA6_9BACL|nr:hypothetical protein [Gemella palaticanis]MBF0714763.1 hypothetical protein [Gemella palaticanis]NYS46693.1 hypothetical protein [Gemella palaticanis]
MIKTLIKLAGAKSLSKMYNGKKYNNKNKTSKLALAMLAYEAYKIYKKRK